MLAPAWAQGPPQQYWPASLPAPALCCSLPSVSHIPSHTKRFSGFTIDPRWAAACLEAEALQAMSQAAGVHAGAASVAAAAAAAVAAAEPMDVAPTAPLPAEQGGAEPMAGVEMEMGQPPLLPGAAHSPGDAEEAALAAAELAARLALGAAEMTPEAVEQQQQQQQQCEATPGLATAGQALNLLPSLATSATADPLRRRGFCASSLDSDDSIDMAIERKEEQAPAAH